jgi:TetR/AcrR family transcriptional regulator, transcriptional repressor for nem operon
MGRPRAFDEAVVIQAAAGLFARRAYDAVSVDDLVTELGVHRNSLYKVFGSKRGLYLAALRWYLADHIRPDRLQPDADLDLLLMALVERAPVDPEVASEINATLREFDAAAQSALPSSAPPALSSALVAAILGLRLRSRAGSTPDGAATVLFDHLKP